MNITNLTDPPFDVELKRHTYNELYLSEQPDAVATRIKELVASVASAAKIDEHGNWEFGAAFDYDGTGSALNWDLYGYGHDIHDDGFLVVIQVRQFERRRRRDYPTIKKS